MYLAFSKPALTSYDDPTPDQNHEELHHLDLGVARFTEFSLTVILTQQINADYYQAKLRILAGVWPILSTRLNRLRSKLIYSKDDRLHTMWSHKRVSSMIGAKLPEFAGEDLPLSIDCSRLEEYFKFPAIVVPTRITKPAVFRLQVVQFVDAAVLKFTIQHPLCDAKGLYTIVSAYCDLLAGKTIPALNPRSTLEVVHDEKIDDEQADHQETLAEESAGDEHVSKGWGSFLMSGVSQWSRKPLGESRIRKAVLVPLPVMMHWRAVADELGIRVSRNDLLMAWIYMCSIPKAGKSPLKYTFVLNVEKLLNVKGDLHNPWCLVPVQAIPEETLRRIRSNTNQVEALILLATSFREIIVNARSPAFMSKTLKDHSDAPIVTPKDFGKAEPNLRISSWSYIDLYGLKFSNGIPTLGASAKTITPRWISGNIDFCPALVWAGLTCDDTIVTWNEERGYWIQGRLHQDIWERIAQSSTVVLLDQRAK